MAKTQEITFNLSTPAVAIEGKKDPKKAIAPDNNVAITAYVTKAKGEEPNGVKSVNMDFEENGIAHTTSGFYVMNGKKIDEPILVLRRNREFNFVVDLTRSYVKGMDTFHIVLEWIDPSGTFTSKPFSFPVVFAVNFGADKAPKKWMYICYKISKEGQSLQCKGFIPDDAFVGLHKFSVETSHKNQKKHTYDSKTQVIVLFNAWSATGIEFFNIEEDRKLYVLEDEGLIYRLDKEKPITWKFNQYNPPQLMAVLHLGTSVGKIQAIDWDKPLVIARGYAKAIKAVAEGNWSGNYSGGTKPWIWNGSGEILTKWYADKNPVKFAHCYVYGGLLVTIFRTLGFAARTVTCYECAVNFDKSLSVDHFFSAEDPSFVKKYREKTQGDSFWSFHVWCEVWFKRTDLGKQYEHASWNAVYADEGPCLSATVKDAKTTLDYEVENFYGKVNADLCIWKVYDKTPLVLVRTDTTRLGHDLSVVGVGRKRVDVTDTYKRKESVKKTKITETESLRKTIEKYANYTESFPLKEFSFELKKVESVKLGEPFTVLATLKNVSSPQTLKVKAGIQVYSFLYTNEIKEHVKRAQKEVDIPNGASEEVKLIVTYDDYRLKLTDDWFLRCYGFATVVNPPSEYVNFFSIKVAAPELKIEVAPPQPKVGSQSQVKLIIANPTPTEIVGTLILQELDCPNRLVLPSQRLSSKGSLTGFFKIVPKIAGVFSIKGTFDSADIHSYSVMRVKILA